MAPWTSIWFWHKFEKIIVKKKYQWKSAWQVKIYTEKQTLKELKKYSLLVPARAVHSYPLSM
jgi:hypothetical protein